MVEYPYNSTNIDISIQFVNSANCWIMPPYIAIVANFQGKLCYYNTNIQEKLINIHKETYEEACKIVKGNKNYISFE